MVDTITQETTTLADVYDARQAAFRAERAATVTKAADRARRAQRYLENTVRNAHDAGLSWAELGELLGVTRQAAQQRYGRESSR